MRVLVLIACFVCLAIVVAPARGHQLERPKPVSKMTVQERERFQERALAHARGTVRFFERHGRYTGLSAKARASFRFHLAMVRWVVRELRETRLLLRRRLMGDLDAWLCIHRYEGAWNDPNAPYYGGLQMDWAFMSTYGHRALGFSSWSALLAAKGTADRWSPAEQIIVAEYARRSGRGYGPWPNTARRCGLI